MLIRTTHITQSQAHTSFRPTCFQTGLIFLLPARYLLTSMRESRSPPRKPESGQTIVTTQGISTYGGEMQPEAPIHHLPSNLGPRNTVTHASPPKCMWSINTARKRGCLFRSGQQNSSTPATHRPAAAAAARVRVRAKGPPTASRRALTRCMHPNCITVDTQHTNHINNTTHTNDCHHSTHTSRTPPKQGHRWHGHAAMLASVVPSNVPTTPQFSLMSLSLPPLT